MAAAKAKEGRGGGGGAAVFLLAALVLGLGGLVFHFDQEARKAERELARVKDEYREMVRLKRPVEEHLKSQKGRGAGTEPRNEDLVTFLSRKATQAQIPANLFSIARNPNLTSGGWKEDSFTVTLRGTKENPIPRASVVDFIRLVEQERPSIRVKNLNLAFAGDPFQSATLTFSAFTRE
jgi:hypothetical protein